MKQDYYVYLHREADTGRPFYVGKGHGKRARQTDKRNAWWTSIYKKHGRTIDFIATELTEDQAYDLEELCIDVIPGLCNLVARGRGTSGFKHRPESRQKMSMAKKGKPLPNGATEKAALFNKGRPRSEVGSRRTREGVTKTMGRQVECVNTGRLFSSMGHAAEWLRSLGYAKSQSSDIHNVVNGKQSHCHGYSFIDHKYSNEL